MNEVPQLMLSNVETRRDVCANDIQHETADTLLSLLGSGSPPRLPCFLSSKRISTESTVCLKLKRVDRSFGKKSNNAKKRIRSQNNMKTKSVTFAEVDDLVYVIATQPYQTHLSDAECLALYREEIWYSVRFTLS